MADDLVARKVLRRDLLIGREAIDNRTMLDLHRPLERGLLKEGSAKDLEAARELLRHLLGLVGVKNSKRRVRAVVGVPAAAMRTNKQYLRNALKGVVDSLMIVSEPFAVAYGLDALLHTMIIDIGAGTTDFCVMKGRYPTEEDQRSLTVAGDSIDAHLHKLVQARIPRRALRCSWCATGRNAQLRRRAARAGGRDGAGQRRADELDITAEMRPPASRSWRRSSKRCWICCRGSTRVPGRVRNSDFGRRRGAHSEPGSDARNGVRPRGRRESASSTAFVRGVRRRTRYRKGRAGQRLGPTGQLAQSIR